MQEELEALVESKKMILNWLKLSDKVYSKVSNNNHHNQHRTIKQITSKNKQEICKMNLMKKNLKDWPFK